MEYEAYMSKQVRDRSKDSSSKPRINKRNIKKSMVYLLVCSALLVTLLYIFPNVLYFDITGFFKSRFVLGLCRIILGAALFVACIIRYINYTNSFKTEGETLWQGILNTMKTGVFQSYLFTLILILGASLVLVVWGIGMIYF